MIDFFQDSGLTVADYMDMLKEKKRARGFSFGRHHGPHDTSTRTIHAESSIAEEATERGVDFEVVPRGSIAAGINRVRQILPMCWFDETRCADGVEALEQYGYTWSPELGMFSKEPEHSRWSHAADALRTFAVGYQEDMDEDYTPEPSQLFFNPLTYNQKGR